MNGRYRDRSPVAAIGVVAGLVVAGVVSWGVFLLAVFTVI